MDQRSCSTPGCGKPMRAKGMCSTHYNQQNVRPVTVRCDACGRTFTKANQWARARYRSACSYECRAFLQHGSRLCAVPDRHPSRSTPVPISHPSRQASVPALTPQFHAGYCAECGKGYVIASAYVSRSTYCSTSCSKRTAKRARRAREHGATGTFTWDGFMRLALSLGNVCAYCGSDGAGQPLEPDHVMPLSRGGHNGLANILPACRWCNGQKHNLLPQEWVKVCKRRGRDVDLARFKHLTAHVFLTPRHAA